MKNKKHPQSKRPAIKCVFVETIEWHYLPELPHTDTPCLIALDTEKTEEILIGYYDCAQDCWWQNPKDVDLFIETPVRAWAYAVSAPPKLPRKGQR